MLPRPFPGAQATEVWAKRESKRRATSASQHVHSGEEGEPNAQQFVAYVPLPDQKAIEQRVLESKKQQLLSKYASEALLAEQAEAKALLNRRA